MLGSLLRRLTGQRPEPANPAPIPAPAEEVPADISVAQTPVESPAEADMPPPGLEIPSFMGPGGPGKSPVFSSRAVRDATVVTGTIDSLNRFVTGQDILDDLTWRLESLTPDQVNFLQLSAEPGLIQRAQARSEALKGAKAAALRKLLTDLAGGAIPEPVGRANPLAVPKGPILPPLASLQPRPGDGAAPAAAPANPPGLGPTNPAPPGPGAPSLTTAPPLVSRPIPPAPAKPAAPVPVPPKPVLVETKVPETKPESSPAEAKSAPAKLPEPPPVETRVAEPVKPVVAANVPEPAPAAKAADPAAKAAETAPAPAPEPAKPAAPPPRPEPAPAPAAASAAAGLLPRLDRQDAEARRARLLASLNDTLSSSEAAP